MKFLIIGYGRIAKRHIRNLKSLDATHSIAVWRIHNQNPITDELSEIIDNVFYSSADALDWHPDAAIICTPSPLHVENGIACAEQGIHLLIEKPLANSQQDIMKLCQICHDRSLVAMVGYNFRFYEPLIRMRNALHAGDIGKPKAIHCDMGHYLPDWHPNTDYKTAASAQQCTGGGVVLELSHEIDMARWLMGEVKSISAMIGKISDLEIDTEDIAEIIIKFSNGSMGHIHLDFLQRKAHRTCKIIGSEGTLTGDWKKHELQIWTTKSNSWQTLFNKPDHDFNTTYIDELRHFISCVHHQTFPDISLNDAATIVEIALAANRSSDEKQVIEL